jgi:hypothetical protein
MTFGDRPFRLAFIFVSQNEISRSPKASTQLNSMSFELTPTKYNKMMTDKTDVESFTNSPHTVGTAHDEELLNEMFEMKSAVHSVRCRMMAMIGVVGLLAFLGMAGSFAALKHSKAAHVDPNTYRLVTPDGHHSVGSVAVGQVFKFPLFTFPMGSYDDVNTSSPNPYVCVGVDSVVDMWRSVLFGIKTQVIVYGAFENHYSPQDLDPYAAGYGAELVWQGATQNKTHACMHTANTHLEVCIVFSSTACASGYNAQEVTTHVDTRRELFNELVFGGSPGISADGHEHEGADISMVKMPSGGRRMKEECTHGHWCEEWVALELVSRLSVRSSILTFTAYELTFCSVFVGRTLVDVIEKEVESDISS